MSQHEIKSNCCATLSQSHTYKHTQKMKIEKEKKFVCFTGKHAIRR